jgi:20S proteasome alpha/beta subunit
LRLELDALHSSSSGGSSFGGEEGGGIGVKSVANLLQQILYGRRSFPYYSFCVVAGLDDKRRRRGGGEGGEEVEEVEGAVHVYDAIGSYERVAVAVAGTGRELLQPILDRSFSPRRCSRTPSSGQPAPTTTTATTADVKAPDQRTGVAGGLISPVRTSVDCAWEEAVRIVAGAYASAAEREISVGDEVVICVVLAARTRRGGYEGGAGEQTGDDDDDGGDDDDGTDDDDNDDDGGAVVKVFRYPLKRH